MPGLRSTSFASTAAHLERPTNMVADGDDALVLLVSLKGTLAASQHGRDVTLRPGDATLLLHSEPSEVTHAQIRFQGLIVPRAPLAALVTNIEDAAMRPVPRENEMLRLLMSYAKTICGGPAIERPDLRTLVTAHIHDIMAMIIGASRDGATLAEEPGVAAARLAVIKAEIIEHIGHDETSLLGLAARWRVVSTACRRSWPTSSAAAWPSSPRSATTLHSRPKPRPKQSRSSSASAKTR
jgi:hypothetical protein